jgi:hypothetical protein
MADARAEMEGLQTLIGEWRMEVALPGAAPIGGASATFESILGGRYVAQRTQVSDPNAPEGLMIIGLDPTTGDYTQHYFDSRGVTRIYAMTFDGREWTLIRETADFSPLDFSQRFVGLISEDRRTIEGRWEQRAGDSDWQLDFALTYRR